MKIAENKAALNSKPPRNRAALGRASKPWPGRLARLALLIGCALSVPARAGEISFRNDVIAVISKAGCNAGTCHGNRAGKAGFKLSLRGEDSELDYAALTHDMFARRTNPTDPDQSLILLKATAQIAHEGGRRFGKDSDEYSTLRRWIADGMPPDAPGTPKLEKIEVAPVEQVLIEPADQIQLKVEATFSDGRKRDVTRLAVYEPANMLAKVSPEGLVQRERLGESTVLVRFLQLQAPARLAFIAARPDFKWRAAPEQNYIDREVFAKLRRMRTNPSALCGDTEFLRRASLDLLGLLPTAVEARAFVADRGRNKCTRLIDRLLNRPEFADFWALKWADLLRNEEKVLDRKGVQIFHRWIRESIAENKPLDQFARELLTARGSTYENPAANYLRAIRTPVARAESTAQLFLGLRLQCAQCHNHPYDRWTQDDYYSWAGLFARVDYKVLQNDRRDSFDTHEFNGEQILFTARSGEVTNARNGKPAPPRFLGAPTPPFNDEMDRLVALAAWLTSPTNSLFARSLANRVWYHLMGRGIVDPIDDFRPTNPPSHPALLDALARDFVAHNFDLRYLIRLIMNSRAYQLSAEPTDTNQDDEVNYSRLIPRRLTAEQLFDAQHQFLAVPAKFHGYPVGMRASQLPVGAPVRRGETKAASAEQFLGLFGKPARLLTCECERSSDTTMGQAFQLISGPTINQLVTNADNRLGALLASGKSSREMIDELYWTGLSRPPSERELAKAAGHLEACRDRREGLEDVAWALLNAKEFILRK